jgi:hypothetical protein
LRDPVFVFRPKQPANDFVAGVVDDLAVKGEVE